MNTVKLYNNDGTLSSQAQSLLSPKPDDMSMAEWKRIIREFESRLSKEDVVEFAKARRAAAERTSRKNYYQKNKEKISDYSRSYYQRQTKEKRSTWRRAHYQRNKEAVKDSCRAYYQKNKEKRNVWQRAYHQKNKEKRRAYKAVYERVRRHKDPLYNFFSSIRRQAVRVVNQVRLGKKPTNTFKWIGCSPEQLKAHIESLFQEGMTWNNYGKYGWHVDHIRPVSSFKPEEWEQINHYTNLQPLWWQDNIAKSDKLL